MLTSIQIQPKKKLSKKSVKIELFEKIGCQKKAVSNRMIKLLANETENIVVWKRFMRFSFKKWYRRSIKKQKKS